MSFKIKVHDLKGPILWGKNKSKNNDLVKNNIADVNHLDY